MVGRDFISAAGLAQIIELRGGVMFWKARGDAAFDPRFAGKPVSLRPTSTGYHCIRVRKREIAAHRAIWALHYGAWPTAYIDHINRDRTDNRIENLRDVPMVVNNLNTDRSPTGGGGVHRATESARWIAQIRYGGRVEHLGSFATRAEALIARKAAELRIYGRVLGGGRAAEKGSGGGYYRASGHPSKSHIEAIARSHGGSV